MLLTQHSGIFRGAAALFIALFLLFAVAPKNAAAYDAIDTERDASLSVTFAPGSKKASNIAFQIYRAAEVSSDCRFTLSDKFSKYPLSLTELDSEGWRALAQTMEGYVAADAIAYDASDKTDSDGTVLFSGLKPGLYLVIGSAFSSGNYTYVPSPFLVCLPNYEDDAWVYDVAAEVKYETKYHGGGGSSGGVTRKVLKAWKNDDKSDRPASVSVTLLKNGTAYSTVTLTESNNWSHTWTGLNSGSTWTLVEDKVPDGYTVTVTKEGVTFLVTNTYGGTGDSSPSASPTVPPGGSVTTPPGGGTTTPPGGDTDDPSGGDTDDPSGGDTDDPSDGDTNDPSGGDTDNPSDGDTKNPSDGDTPGDSDHPNIPELPNDSKKSSDNQTASGASSENANNLDERGEKLPQTGLTWWPIPFLAIGGLVLFTAGWVKQKKDGDGDER